MNKGRITLYTGLGFFLAGLLLFIGAVKIALPAAAATRSISLLQNAVRTADEVEIDVLSATPINPGAPHYRTKIDGEDYAIASTRQLTPEQTKEFLTLLESHWFSAQGGALCHDPGYLLRFHRQGRVILTCSLCLHCTNLEIEPYPFVPIWVAIVDPTSHNLRLPRIEGFLSDLDLLKAKEGPREK